LYKLAADQDLSIAEYIYGIFVREGFGVDLDLPVSARYLKCAADQGFPAIEPEAFDPLESVCLEMTSRDISSRMS
jgi:TPR repeat protein